MRFRPLMLISREWRTNYKSYFPSQTVNSQSKVTSAIHTTNSQYLWHFFSTRSSHRPMPCNIRKDKTIASVFHGKLYRPQQQQNYNPFSNTYNPGQRDHVYLRYGNSPGQFQQPQQHIRYNIAGPSTWQFPQQVKQDKLQNNNAEPSSVDLVKQMAIGNIQFQYRT